MPGEKRPTEFTTKSGTYGAFLVVLQPARKPESGGVVWHLLDRLHGPGHPVLRTAASPVILPASDATRRLIDDMLATLRRRRQAWGSPLSQVYEPVAIFIVASQPNSRYPDAPVMEPEVVINPEIMERSQT